MKERQHIVVVSLLLLKERREAGSRKEVSGYRFQVTRYR